MKTMLSMLICILALPLLFSCSNQPTGTDQSETVKPPKVASDKRTCLDKEGKWLKVGLLGHYMCVFKASDAGKACMDSKECEYRCLAVSPFNTKTSTKVTGACQATSNPFGCHSVVIDGVAQPGLCID